MGEPAEGVDVRLVEITLVDGGTLEARTADRDEADLDRLQRSLQESEFVRIGDDTLVRSGDVRSVQLRSERSGGGGLIESLMSRVGGRDDAAEVDERERFAVPDAAAVARLVETKPFFLTSEFVLTLAAWIGLAITAAATDTLDDRSFWLLTIVIAAVYTVSRGFGKADTPSAAGDPRDELFNEQGR